MHDPCRRGMDHSFFAVSGNDARNSCIWRCRPFGDDPCKVMPSLRFYDKIYVLSGFKARSQRDSERCHVPRCSKISLCKDRIDQRIRFQLFHRFPALIDKDRKLSILPDFLAFTDLRDQPSCHSLNAGSSIVDCLSKRNFSSDRAWSLTFQYQYLIAASI